MSKAIHTRLSIICLGIFSALMLVEGSFRIGALWTPPAPSELYAKSLLYDSSIFSRHVLQPGPREVEIQQSPQIRYRINSLGYRGPDFLEVKSPGRTRVMIYGGSAVFDVTANEEQDWPHKVGRILRERGHGDVEVINAGTPGHASFDNLGTYLTEGHSLGSDYVLLMNEWNDIKSFGNDGSLLRSMKPYDPYHNPFIYSQGAVDGFLAEHVLLYRFIRGSLIISSRSEFNSEGELLRQPGVAGHISARALAQFKLTVASFVDAVRNGGAEAILVTEPHLPRPDNEAVARAKIRYDYVGMSPEVLCQAFDEAEGVVKDLAHQKNVPLVDSSLEMSGREQYFADHVHLTPLGSSTMAVFVADRLELILGHRVGR